MTDWISPDELKTALGIDPIDSFDDDWIDRCCDAVNAFVDATRVPPILPGADPPAVLDPLTVWGALQLGTRWYSRRNSNDLTAFAELGGVPPSIDRDIAVALRIERYYGPVAV